MSANREDALRQPRVVQLPIDRLMQNSSFGPQEAAIFRSAYEEIVAGVAHPMKPRVPITIAELIARKIIAIGHTDERDRARIVERVFEEIGIQKPARRTAQLDP
jgi:hypothetical protein